MANEPTPGAGAPAAAAPAAAPAAAEPKATVLSDAKSQGNPVDPAAAPAAAAGDGVTPAPGEGEGKAAAAPAAKAPAVYDLKVPEDALGLIDDGALAYIKAAGKKVDWTNAEAQAAVDELTGVVKAQSETYRAETAADPTYGGEHLEETQRLAHAAINRLRPEGHPRHDSFQAALALGGIGNHIEFVSLMADLGRMIGEDKPAAGKAAGAGSKDPVAAFYDHPTSQSLAASKRPAG